MTDTKEFQHFEQGPLFDEGLCSKRGNSLRSVTAVINLLTFHKISSASLAFLISFSFFVVQHIRVSQAIKNVPVSPSAILQKVGNGHAYLKVIQLAVRQRFCRSDKFQYRFKNRINHGEWLYWRVLKRTRGTHTECENTKKRHYAFRQTTLSAPLCRNAWCHFLVFIFTLCGFL